MSRLRLPLLAACAAGLAATPALADVHVALDGHYSWPTNDGLRNAHSDPQFGVRLGWAFDIPVVDIVLEARGLTLNFGSDLDEEKDGWAGWGAQGGLQVGVGLGAIRPAFFAHVGYGETEVVGSDYSELRHGILLDGGLAVTFTLLPVVGVGAHLVYNALLEQEETSASRPDSSQWLSLGLHLEFRL